MKNAAEWDVKDVENLLTEWAAWARADADHRLGYPRASFFGTPDPLKKNQKKTMLTASGKQTEVATAPTNSSPAALIMAVDRIIGQASDLYKEPLTRRYLRHQPDRIAARQLRMVRADYTAQVEAAVKWVANQLEDKTHHPGG